MKILIIEDDGETAEFVATGLKACGHVTKIAENGRQGFEAAGAETFDVIVLDRMLPEFDGLSVVALLRSEGVSTPVLFLTNLSGVDDRVEGLGAGGDDYLVKPFAFEELLARLEALARRPTLGSTSTVLTAGDLISDLFGSMSEALIAAPTACWSSALLGWKDLLCSLARPAQSEMELTAPQICRRDQVF
jgi:two-component system OmpR family response regulator